jgi:diguanylate cyclase (GGDEF)-like protein
MRGHEDPAARRAARLKRAAARPLVQAGTATVLLALLVLVSGAAASPLIALLAVSLVLLSRLGRSALVFLATGLATAAVVGPALWAGAGVLRGFAAAAGLLAAAGIGLAWRREAQRTADRLNRLDDILDHARRGESAPAPDAAAALADLQLAASAVASRLRAQQVVLWDVDGARGTARPRAASRGTPAARNRLAGDPLGWVWEQGLRMQLDPAPTWSRPGQVVVADRLVRDGDHGVILTCAFDPADVPQSGHALDEAAVYMRGVIALQAATAQVGDVRRRLAALLAGLHRIPGEMELDTLAADLCATAMSITDGTGAVVGSWSGELGEILAVAGADGGPRPGDTFTAPDSELALAIRADTMIVRTALTWKLDRTGIARRGERWVQLPRAMAALPLRSADGIVGVLAVWSSRVRALEQDSLDLLHALAPYAAQHMAHARAFGNLRESAERDPLTTLRNRRAFDRIFAAETVRFERYGHSLAVLILDLDHFKAVNDTYGHEAGDEVLRSVARLISGCVRDVDTAARFGGEEFIVLLPETRMAAATDVAERIRIAVANADIGWRGISIPVRVSIGVTACPQAADHPRDLVASADAALYAAKAGGRNRVVQAGTPAGVGHGH